MSWQNQAQSKASPHQSFVQQHLVNIHVCKDSYPSISSGTFKGYSKKSVIEDLTLIKLGEIIEEYQNFINDVHVRF